MTADEVKKLLGLVPHPREGGWYMRTFEAREFVGAEVGRRRTSTAIYYLLEPGTFSEMHRLKSDEVVHHYLGGAVEMLRLFGDGRGERVLIGKNLEAGERPQVVVERGVWQGSRLVGADGFALLGRSVSPGFEFEDYEAGVAGELCEGWGEWREMILGLTRGKPFAV